MSSALTDSGLHVLEFSRRTMLAFLEDIPEDKWCHQPMPDGNHAMWVAGHLASTDDYFLSQVAQKPSQLPGNWNEMFGMGSKPVGDLSAYPAPGEVRDRLGSLRSDLLAWLKSLSEADLTRALPDDVQQFVPNLVALPGSIAWHEGMHAGQLTMVRKSLGLGPKFG